MTAVQALAGILLPASTIFLLLLCNDRGVLGPWVNKTWLNLVAGLVIAVLFVLSFLLTFTTIFPHLDVVALLQVFAWVLGIGFVVVVVSLLLYRRRNPRSPVEYDGRRELWRMPPAALLDRPEWSVPRRITMYAMGAYMVISIIMLFVKSVTLTGGGH